MKDTIKIIVIITTLLLNQTAFAIYIPDLFGAYQRGANQAQYENQRDAAYYYELSQENSYNQEPIMYLEVWKKDRTISNILHLSLSRKDELCWSIRSIGAGETIEAKETITTPYSGSFMGQSPNSNIQRTITSTKINSSSTAFTKQVTSINGMLYSCWNFPSNTPKGTYSINVSITGGINFTRSFVIMD